MCIQWVDILRAGAATAVASILTLGLVHAQGYPNTFQFGQPATEQDIAVITIAIPTDGKGLPPGRGDSARGEQVYETACAACHGADLMGVANIPNMPTAASLRLIGGRGTLTSPKAVVTVESYWQRLPCSITFAGPCRSRRLARSRRTKSTRCVLTSFQKPRSSTKRRCSTRKPRRASKCPIAMASFPTRGRNCSSNIRRDALAPALGRRRVDLLAMSAVSTSRKSGNPSPMSAGKTGKPLLVLSFRGFDPKGNSGAFTRLAYRP